MMNSCIHVLGCLLLYVSITLLFTSVPPQAMIASPKKPPFAQSTAVNQSFVEALSAKDPSNHY